MSELLFLEFSDSYESVNVYFEFKFYSFYDEHSFS